MKIAEVVSTFFPHFGGMGLVCEEESDGLSNQGHDVTVFTLRYPSVRYAQNFFLFNIERLFPLVKMGDAGLIPQLSRRLRDFDIVHLHYPFYGGAEWVWWAKKFFGKKYFVTYHMMASPSGLAKRFVQKVYDFVWQKRILLGAEKILVVDKKYWSALPFAKEIPEDRVVEFPNGVNLKIFSPGAADWDMIELKDWQKKKIILFVGNLLLLKKLDLLIRALAKIQNDDWRLVIVGGGYEEMHYQKLVSDLGLKNKVKFAGYCFDREKLVEYYRAAWVSVLPTDNESFSLVAIESLACGTPVILSADSGGANRITTKENGWTFVPGSEESLRSALVQSLSVSVEDHQGGVKLRRDSIVDYDWNNHNLRLEQILDSEYGK